MNSNVKKIRIALSSVTIAAVPVAAGFITRSAEKPKPTSSSS